MRISKVLMAAAMLAGCGGDGGFRDMDSAMGGGSGIRWSGPAGADPFAGSPFGFGGSPFNTDYVFGTAERAKSNPNGNQNNSRFDTSRSTLQNFTATLQARLLNQISDDVVTAIFGEDAQDQGRFEVAGTVIEFARNGDTVNLVITDTANGQSTTIDVPVPRL